MEYKKADVEQSTEDLIMANKIPRIGYTAPYDLYAFFTENEIKITNYIIESIQYGIKHKLNDVDVFELKHTHNQNNSVILNLSKEEWIPSLQLVIDKFKTEEKFEDCIPLQQMIDEINVIPIKTVKTNKRKNGTKI